MKSLDRSQLASLPGSVIRPEYDPSKHGVGIVHVGLGAFHRAHQAWYVDEMIGLSGGDWRIAGVSCHSTAARDHLLPQDCLYTVAERSDATTRRRVIGALATALHAPSQQAEVLGLLAAPSTHLVTLTVTEKAYQPASPELLADRAGRQGGPRSAIGLVVASLALRHRAGGPAPTVMSCDNLRDNGRVLKQLVVEQARAVDVALAEWIERTVAFPCTMVDRIVPATSPEALDEAAAELGVRDAGLVVTEPFSQWVIEDSFAGPRPPLDGAGATFVRDVRPFEIAKLRLLNGSHSTLAYAGLLLGHQYVHEAIADETLRPLVRHLMSRELAPTLIPTPGLDVDAYQQALLQRFGNRTLQHRLRQIAMDGSQKLPQRLVAPLRERLARAQPIAAVCFAIAAWMRFISTSVDSRGAIPLEDPMADRLRQVVLRAQGNPELLVPGLLALPEVFGADLSGHPLLTRTLTRQVRELGVAGARPAMQQLLEELHRDAA